MDDRAQSEGSSEPEWLSDPEDSRSPYFVDRDAYKKASRMADHADTPDTGPVPLGEVTAEVLKGLYERIGMKPVSFPDSDKSASA